MSEITIQRDSMHAVPQQIARTLSRLIRRNRMVILLRGISATAATAVAGLLVVMAIDASVTLFAAWPRWVLSLSAFTATIAVAVLYLFRPLAHSFTMAGVARVIEDRHPEMHERLSSAVELLTSQDGPEIRGSDTLIMMLATEATQDARAVRPRAEVTLRPARPFLAAAVAVVAVLLGLYALWPQRTIRLLKRALAPGANLPNIQADELRMVPDHDVIVAEGDRLVVTLEVANSRVTEADFRKIEPGGSESVEPMIRVEDSAGWRKFALTCPPASSSFRFRVHAGDALTQYVGVTVVPRPAIRKVDLKYDFPTYTHRDPQVVEDFQAVDQGRGKISAVAGTVVTITATCNTPLSAADVLINDEPLSKQDITVSDDGRSFQARVLLKPKLTGICTLRPQWALKLTESRTSAAEAEDEKQYPIEALYDQKPRVDVRVRKVDGKLRLKPTDRLPFGYTFTDDHGLSKAELLIRVDGRPRPPMPVDLPAGKDGKPVRQVQGAGELDLSKLDLDNARRVAFRLQATDNLPPDLKGPQTGESVEHTIELAPKEKPYKIQVALAQELQIRRTLEQVLQELEEAQKDSVPLRKEVPKEPDLSKKSTERISRMRQHLQKADGLLRELLPQMTGQAYEVLAGKLTDVADNHIAKADSLAGQIPLESKPKTRGELADETDFQVGRAHTIIAELLGKFAVMTDVVRRAQELQELAERQKDLAAAKAALENPQQPGTEQDNTALKPPGDLQQMTREQIDREQADIANRMRELARKTPGLPQAQSEADRKKAENLAQTARELAKDQLALAGDTRQVGQLEQANKALDKLAAEQAQLAKSAEAAKTDPQATGDMAKAAEDIKSRDLDNAVAKQTQAEGALKQQKQEIDKALASESLADKAQKIAEQQAALAKSAKQAQAEHDAAQAKAQQANQQAQTAQQQGQQAKDQLGDKLAEFAKQQQALAQRAKALEQKVAANPAAQSARDTKPSQPMDSAAKSLAAKEAQQGLNQARDAAQQAQNLQNKLQQATAQGKQQTQDRQGGATQADQKAKQAADQAAKAQQAAAQAKQQADQADAAGQQAKAKAQQAANDQAQADKASADAQQKAQQAKAAADQAQAAARDAAAKAQQPGLTPEQKQAAEAAAKQAAEQAQAAKQAGDQAQAAQQAADQKAQAAKQAGQQAQAAANAAAQKAAADKQAADKQAQAAQQADQQAKAQAQAAGKAQNDAGSTRQAAEQADQATAEAKQLAQDQKKLADQIAESLGEQNNQQGQSQATAQQAKTAAQQQAQAAQAAKQKVAGLATQQDALKQQTDQLTQQAASASPQAKQAAEQHNPSPAMQQAAKDQRSGDTEQGAKSTQAAADKAAELAQALKDATQQAQAAAQKSSGEKQPAGQQAPSAAQQASLAKKGQAAQKLAAQQEDLRRRTEQLAAQRKQILDAAEQGQMARLQAEQAQIARDAAKMADQVKEAAPQADRLDTKAARAAQETGEQIARRDTAKAAEAATDAAGKMSELAKRLGAEKSDLPKSAQEAGKESGQEAGKESGQQSGKESGQEAGKESGQEAGKESGQESGKESGQESGQQSGKQSGKGGGKDSQVAVQGSAAQQPGEPGGDEAAQQKAQLAKGAAGLAKRQDRVAGELRDLAKDQPEGVMASRQDQINQDTAALADKAGLIREHAEELIQDAGAQQAAQQAANALAQAAQSQKQASGAMPASPSQAVPSQQNSAAQLNAAAQALGRLGQQLAAAAQRAKAANPDQQPQEPPSPLLTDAMDQTKRAARTREPQDAELAAQLLGQLAAQASQQAAAMGLQPDAASQNLSLSDPFGPSNGQGTGPQNTDLTLLKLEEMGISPSDWARLPGQLRDEVLQAASDKSPPEYRALIKRYFQEIARRSRQGQDEGGKQEKNK